MSGSKQYDSFLGGNQELPSSINLMKFTAARSKEIQTLKQSLASVKGVKLAFQRLPKHMRRRVMSHNAKRLPRRLREIHISQQKKSGAPPKSKRPSRKYRRRPRNLLEDYTRRQKKHAWLETHIWHAKRFHMIDKWGYRLAESPCDKSFKACYRATAKHCLIQDISYNSCIEITGSVDIIVNNIKQICNVNTGLSIGAQAFIKGNREGCITLFTNKQIDKAVGEVTFMWKTDLDNKNRKLWIWSHAAFYNLVLSTLIDLFELTLDCPMDDGNIIPNEYANSSTNIKLKELKGHINRFRLTGPLSHAILQNTLKTVDINTNLNSIWLKNYLENDDHRQIFSEQIDYWKSIKNINSPAILSPHIILSLICSDPRYNFPMKRTKAVPTSVDGSCNLDMPINISASPIWDDNIRTNVKESKVSNSTISEWRSQLLVPGTELLDHPGVPVPFMLIQRPGNKNDNLGYCSGWDLIMPSGWAQATWMCLIMWGGRAGGLRESDSIQFEMGKTHILQPDTAAGIEEEKFDSEKCIQKYFRLPPNKRTNYNKFSIVSPFKYHWNIIIRDWKESANVLDDFRVLRDQNLLKNFQECLKIKNRKTNFPSALYNEDYLVPIKLKLLDKGKVRQFAIICLPEAKDLEKRMTLSEPIKEDKNQEKRKTMRDLHKVLLKRLKKQRSRAKEKGKKIEIDTEMLASYQSKMRELWLPPVAGNIRNSCSKQIMGFVTKGDFSFVVGQSCAVGFVAIGSLKQLLLQKCRNKVLVRNTNSRQYRTAAIEIILFYDKKSSYKDAIPTNRLVNPETPGKQKNTHK